MQEMSLSNKFQPTALSLIRIIHSTYKNIQEGH